MGCYGKYLWKISLIFGKERPQETLQCAQAYTCVRGHAYACLWHVHECMDIRTQLGFQKLCKESFLYLILVWNKSHII